MSVGWKPELPATVGKLEVTAKPPEEEGPHTHTVLVYAADGRTVLMCMKVILYDIH